MQLWILLGLLLWQVEEHPIGQVRIPELMAVYAQPNQEAPRETNVRPGEVHFLYQIQNGWGRTEAGWLMVGELDVEPAVVDWAAPVEDELFVQEQPEIEARPRQKLASEWVGVAAAVDGWGLVYAPEGVGWVELSELELTEPGRELRDFVQQVAYVQVETTVITFDDRLYTLPLGEKVTVLHREGDSVLVRGDTMLGWGRAAHFDLTPRGVAYAEMNAGPVNFRTGPETGQVVDVLDYLEEVLLLGRNASADWVYVRTAAGADGWVAADYVRSAYALEDLPLIEE